MNVTKSKLFTLAIDICTYKLHVCVPVATTVLT